MNKRKEDKVSGTDQMPALWSAPELKTVSHSQHLSWCQMKLVATLYDSPENDFF